jgi:hypothetical protein
MPQLTPQGNNQDQDGRDPMDTDGGGGALATAKEIYSCLDDAVSVFTDLVHSVSSSSTSPSQKLHWSCRRDLANLLKKMLKFDALSKLQKFADCFMRLLKDEDHRVRVFMATSISIFFELFEDETGMLKTIQELIPVESEKKQSPEFQMTALYSLSEIATVSSVNEGQIVYKLVKCIADGIQRSLSKYLLERIAKKLKYNSLLAFLEYHLEHLFRCWTLTEKRSIDEFPVFLFERHDLPSFLTKYADILLPHLILSKDTERLSTIADALSKGLKDLIKDRFSRVFASTFPLYYTDKQDLASEICENFLSSYLKQEGFKKASRVNDAIF